MKPSDTTGYFAYWNARDYAETPRRIRGLQLFLNTECNRRCPECAASIPSIRHPEHYPLTYVQRVAEYFYGIEHVTISGGEPTLHPHFREIAPHLKAWFGCRSLTLETNGYHLDAYQDLLGCFDDILLSHYPDNQAITEQLAALDIDGRPAGPTRHVATARRARRPSPCRRANFVQYAYGRVYPCACIPSGHEGIGIPLTANWREEIVTVPLPCADCCFAEEAHDEDAKNVLTDSHTTIFIPNRLQRATEVRPAWRWPTLREDIKIYGLDLDSWMGREAEIMVNTVQGAADLIIMVESAAPVEHHPITLTFTHAAFHAPQTHFIPLPGLSLTRVDLRHLPADSAAEIITLSCDQTFIPSEIHADRQESRELGVRIRSLRYERNAEQPRRERLEIGFLQELAAKDQELMSKEMTIRRLLEELDAKNELLQALSVIQMLRLLAKQYLPESLQEHIRQSRRIMQPKLGQLHHHAPIPFVMQDVAHLSQSCSKTLLTGISIVTPSFNQGRFVERTIRSVLNQQYPHLEYLIQDGGSTDETTRILTQYQAQLTAIESERDEGQGAAINCGFRKTTGEIMAWLNADDVLLPGAVADVANFFAAHPDVDVVYSHRLIIDEQDREIGRWILPPHDNNMLRWADYVPQETLFWRRRIWDNTGGYIDESFQFALDWELLLRFQEAGAIFARLPRFLAAFRVHPQQKTSTLLDGQGFQEMMRLRERIHGRPVSHEEAHRHLRGYLRKHLWYHYAYRAGMLRY